MNFRRMAVRMFLGLADGWNHEIHQATQEKVLEKYQQMFPPQGDDDLEQRQMQIKEMHSFYYARIIATANFLISVTALLVAVVALFVAIVPLFNIS